MSGRKSKPRLLKCVNGHYSISETCVTCGANVFNPEPPRFSLKDKYGKQRRKALYGI